MNENEILRMWKLGDWQNESPSPGVLSYAKTIMHGISIGMFDWQYEGIAPGIMVAVPDVDDIDALVFYETEIANKYNYIVISNEEKIDKATADFMFAEFTT